MKQRYDLLAISLLMFTAVLAVFLVVGPVSLETVWRWQTLIGGMFTFAGVVVASWNVTRQMRLAARGREQDRIERELPGLRAASFFLGRFVVAFGKAKDTERLFEEFKSLGVGDVSVADFIAKIVDSLPLTPDALKRQLALELVNLRRGARGVVRAQEGISAARNNFSFRLLPISGNPPDVQARIDAAIADRDRLQAEFEADAFAKFEQFRLKLIDRGRSESQKAAKLRRELDRSIAIES